MGKCTNGDEVDTCLGIVAKRVEGNAARRLGLIATCYHLNGLARIVNGEVIEHDAVDTSTTKHTLQLVEVAHFNLNLQVKALLAQVGMATVDGIFNATSKVNVVVLQQDHIEKAYAVEPLEDRIDNLCETMKQHHVTRLQSGSCTISQGFPFNDLITNYERVADHCSNIAIAMIELNQNDFAMHGYLIALKKQHAHRFDEYYKTYTEKYKF